MSHYPKPPPGVVNTAPPSTVQTPLRTPAPRPHMQVCTNVPLALHPLQAAYKKLDARLEESV